MCSLLLLSERESSLRRPAPDAVPRRSDLREWIARKRIAVGQTPRALTCRNLHLSRTYLTNGEVHDNHPGTAHRGGFPRGHILTARAPSRRMLRAPSSIGRAEDF